MKKLVKLSMMVATAFCALQASAALLSYSGSPGLAIPDNNPSGLGFGFNVNTPEFDIESLTVTLNISGGYNGDIYAYLSHASGFAVLLNRTGVTGSDPAGYPDNGFSVMLVAGGTDIHDYRTTLGGAPAGGVLTGTWGADGRLEPTDILRENTLDVFTGQNPNGDWTLFLADRSPGSISTLDSWMVDIEAVPEPANVALAVFGGIFAFAQGVRLWRQRRAMKV